MRIARAPLREHQAELVAALGLICIYLAVMSGHLMSIDGLGMWRQAIAMTYHLSWSIQPPLWWGGFMTSSSRGVGASLEYAPSLVLFSWLSGHLPVQPAAQYDYRLFYGDILYTVAGAPVWVIITATTAYLVALITGALGFGRRQALWAMALYGLGSPALMASRGDTPQPLVAICWAITVYACLRHLNTGGQRWLWLSGAAILYGSLTRPLEGSMAVPGAVVLLGWRAPKGWIPPAGQVAVWLGAVILTVLTNWARFGSPARTGYLLGTAQASWTTPVWQGIPNDLLSPGRGLLWEFPALVLGVWGVRALWGRGLKTEALVLAVLPAVLFIEACTFTDWVGGWDWGLRFMQPALPLLAVLAGVGVSALPQTLKGWLPALVLAIGFSWNIPAIATDILGGYGAAYADGPPNWRLDAYPPIGAWRFLHHVFPAHGTDSAGVDIVWFRATLVAGKAALIPFALLLALAVALWGLALRAGRRSALLAAERDG